MRVVVVSESGDWGKCRKGLPAWSPDKTPGAGSASGGRLAPLVALWCPVSAETGGDADALLERLAKMKRRFVDLGEIERSEMSRHLMDASTIRARWDAAHPGAAVGVVDAVTKVKRGKVA